MTTLREAAQQALDFIRWSQFVPCQSEPFPEPPSTAPQVEAALKAALAEPVQEPVWVCPDSAEHRYGKPGHCEDCGNTLMQEPVAWMDINGDGNRLTVRQWSDGNKEEVPLYTYQPQRKPLTEEEIEVLEMQHAPPIHPDFSETDDWLDFARAIERAHGIDGAPEERNFCPRCGKRTNGIHTCTPPAPLTDEVIADLWHQNGGFHHHFARAIERWLRGHA